MLNLEGVVDFVEGGSADEEGGVEVNVVEVDGVVNFGEDADDDKALTEEGDGFADGFGGAKESVGELGADDGGGSLGVFTEEGAVFEAEVLNLDEVGVGADDGGGGDDGVSLALEGVDRDGEGRDGGNVVDFFDGGEVF